MKKWFFGSLFMMMLLLAACGGKGDTVSTQVGEDSTDNEIWEQSITGYVADKDETRILLLGKITKEQLNTMSVNELLETARPEAYWFKVDNIDQYEIGQKLEVWPTGAIAESYPAQGMAGKIEVLDDAE
ncbi:YobA family protein [Pseudalkalibacillus sp. SCS-8]|uniref:YobA family protein n=1 Tax=Pseudalkalibacillus nanhaiensis TaxID=3115291 RepID=UPI0032DADF51